MTLDVSLSSPDPSRSPKALIHLSSQLVFHLDSEPDRFKR